MSVYDAGAIRATAELNRDPFIEGIRQCQTEGNRFAAQRFTATAGMDVQQARRDLAQLQLHMRQVAEEEVVIRARADVDKAIADLERLRAEQRRVDEENTAQSRRRTSAAKEEQKQIGLLRTAIEYFGPQVITLGGGLLGLSAGAAAFGASGILAFKGVSEEMKAGTALGEHFHGGLNVLQNDLTQLERTNARGVMGGFDQSVISLNRNMPMLNNLLGQSSVVLGSTVSHLVNGLLGGLGNFQPLILDAEHTLDGFAAYFDRWANSSKAANFGETLDKDMKVAIPTLEQLLKLVEHLLAAGNNVGMPLLTDLGLIARALNGIPVGVLTALLDGYLAFRTIGIVTTIIDTATKSLLGLAAAESAAGAAGAGAGAAGAAGRVGGARGALAAGLGFLSPVIAGTAAFGLGLNLLDSQTKPMITDLSTGPTARHAATAVDQVKNVFGDLFTGHWSFHNALAGPSREELAALKERSYIDATNALLADIMSGQSSGAAGAYSPISLTNTTTAGIGHAGLTPAQLAAQQRANLYAQMNAQNAYVQTNVTPLVQQFAGATGRASDISTASSNLSSYQQTLSKAIATEKSWTDVKDKDTISVGKNTYEMSAWNAALKQAHGDANAAIGILQGHSAALDTDQRMAAQLVTEQQNLNAALDLAQTKYGLTTQQAQAYAQVMGVTPDMLASGTVSLDDWDAALGKTVKTLQNAGPSMTSWIAAVQQFDSTADTAISRAQLMGQAMVSLQGDNLGYANTMVQAASANQQLVNDFHNLHKGILNLKTGSLDYHNAGAAPILNDLSQLQTAAMNAAEATYTMEARTGNLKKAAYDASQVFQNDTRGALIAEAKQLGLTKTEADKLADRYFSWPKDATTQIQMLGQDNIQPVLTNILQDLDALSGNHYADLYLNLHADSTATIKSGPYAGKEVRFSADGNIFDYYAAGGFSENHVAQIADASVMRVWAEPETGGEAYIPLHPNKRQRSQEIASQTVRRLGGVAYFEQGGFIVDPTSGSKSGSSGGKVTVTEMRALLTSIENELRAMGVLGKDTASQIAGVESALTAAFNTAHQYGIIPSTVTAALAKDNAALTAEVKIRDSTAAALKVANTNLQAAYDTATNEAHGIENTVLGAFDIGTSGNGYSYGITASLGADIKTDQQFIALRDQAKALGLDPRLIAQLTKEGPQVAGANLQAIVNGGASYVKGLNAQYSQFVGLSQNIGWAQANDDNLAKILVLQATQQKDAAAAAAAQAKTNTLISQLIALTKDLDAKAEARARQMGL